MAGELRNGTNSGTNITGARALAERVNKLVRIIEQRLQGRGESVDESRDPKPTSLPIRDQLQETVNLLENTAIRLDAIVRELEDDRESKSAAQSGGVQGIGRG